MLLVVTVTVIDLALALSEKDACGIGFNFSKNLPKMRPLLKSIVSVPAPVAIAPPKRPSTDSLVVDELGEFMFGVTGRVAEVWSALDENDGVVFEPIKVRQVRPDMHWDAVAELIERSLDPRQF